MMPRYFSHFWVWALLGIPLCWGLQQLAAWVVDDYYLIFFNRMGINILLALSLNFIAGKTGLFSLGHAGFMAIGAYVSSVLTLWILPFLFPSIQNLPAEIYSILFLVIALVLAGFSSAVVGFLLAIPTLRLRGDYLAIATLGLGEIIRVLLLNLTGTVHSKLVGGASGISEIPLWASSFWIYWVLLLTLLLFKNLDRSLLGKTFLAIREDEIAAQSIGISVTRVKTVAFTLGAFFAGVGGALFANSEGYINPDMFSFSKSIELLSIVVLGGMGSIRGTIVAAIVLTWLQPLFQQFVPQLDQYRMIFYALALIGIMIFRAYWSSWRRLQASSVTSHHA